ncbi:hypothetical protein GCM10007301_36900 [Azorhizobium oxalatiphilum]|uniref:Uncharacterized protein n=1 Tax=Azorhizobium oxalatiphilum TaxID=980631 RepID=A0A917C600_9HYPH|nr:hypothetical protein [Azorhizobium oxalatiphilum]GGF73717.1 hypothetical protein GCM10007301_36900 [Azorhizobium oxalatiphilum]
MTVEADVVTIPRANAVDVHVASEFGLLILSGASAVVSTIPGGITIAINVPPPGADFTVGTQYRVGGHLLKGGTFSCPNAEFIGYGAGVLHNVATFRGPTALPPK